MSVEPFKRSACSLALWLVTLTPIAVLVLVLDLVGVAILVIILGIPWRISRFLDKAWAAQGCPNESPRA